MAVILEYCKGSANSSDPIFQGRCYGFWGQSMLTLWPLISVSVDGMVFGVSQCRAYGPWVHIHIYIYIYICIVFRVFWGSPMSTL